MLDASAVISILKQILDDGIVCIMTNVENVEVMELLVASIRTHATTPPTRQTMVVATTCCPAQAVLIWLTWNWELSGEDLNPADINFDAASNSTIFSTS